MADTPPTTTSEPPGLQPYKLPSLPSSLYYLPTFLTPQEQSTLQSSLAAYPPGKWTQLSHRRLLALPSPLTGLKKDTLLTHPPLPEWVTREVGAKFAELGVFAGSPHGERPNHVLINEYQPGQGIMPHEDGPGYFPCVATVSLGGHMVLNILEKETRRVKWRVLQEPGSLLVTREGMYVDYLHGIDEVEEDEGLNREGIANWDQLSPEFRQKVEEAGGRLKRETRISFTFRDVIKVKDLTPAFLKR